MAFVYDDWMRGLDEEEGNPVDPQQRSALLSYLNGKSTAKEAAHGFTKQVAESKGLSADLDWSLLFDAAQEFRQAHQQLMLLLDAIAQLPSREDGTTRNAERQLPGFVFELREAVNGVESASQSSHSTITDERHYINLCAFIARFWHHQHGEWTSWAMQLSHDGLELDHRRPLTNLFGQAVGQLFLFSGAEMYSSGNATDSSEHSAGPLLLKERETADVSRWHFWKRRVGQLKTSEILSNETRELFSKVLEAMAKVETESRRDDNAPVNRRHE